MDMDKRNYLYDAFISYRRSDGSRIAAWLRSRLQDYVLPPKLAGGRKKLRIYLDTAFERANEDFWTNNIEPGLRKSRFLVVVATPDTLHRRVDGTQNWVEREIEFFLSLPQGRNVLVVRAKGEFAAELPGDLSNRFPQITIVDLRAFSPFADRLYLRAPLRERLLTVLGTLHNIDSSQMPELRMEDARKARARATSFGMIAMTLFVVISGLAITAFIQRNNAQAEARRADQNAKEAKRESKIAEENAEEAMRQTKNAVANEAEAKREKNIAEENAHTAERNARQAQAREFAAYANQSLSEDPERSILLGMQAVESTVRFGEPQIPPAEDVLHEAILSSRVLLTLRGHSRAVDCVAFSPDGRRLATSSADSTTKVWDTTSGKELLTLRGHSGAVYALAFSPDGKLIATSSTDQTSKVWDAVKGQEVMTLPNFAGRKLASFPFRSENGRAVAFSPDGRLLATVTLDSVPKIWDPTTGRELLTLRNKSNSPIKALSFSPDGRRLAIVGSQYMAIWSIVSGQELLTLRGHSDSAFAVSFNPDGKRLVTADFHTATVWDAASGQELMILNKYPDRQQANRLSLTNRVEAIDVSPDGKQIATAGSDKTATLWDSASGKELLTLHGHLNDIPAVVFSPDSMHIATGSVDGTAKLWDLVKEHELLTLYGHSNIIEAATFSPDSRRLATASVDQTAKVWDAVSGKELLTLRGHSKVVFAVAFNRDGRRLATASADGTAKVWDAISGKELLTLRGHSSNLVFGITFSPDGKRLATASADGTARVWDAITGHELLVLPSHSGPVVAVAFSPDGRCLATASYAKKAAIWDAATGRELLALTGHPSRVYAIAFSPNGRRVATACVEGTVKVWDIASGKELLSLRGRSNYVESDEPLSPDFTRTVAFSSDGKRLAATGWDDAARIWDASSGQELLNLRGHSNRVIAAAFSPNSKRFVTAGADKTVQVYTLEIHELLNLARSRITRGFTQDECRRYFQSETCPPVP